MGYWSAGQIIVVTSVLLCEIFGNFRKDPNLVKMAVSKSMLALLSIIATVAVVVNADALDEIYSCGECVEGSQSCELTLPEQTLPLTRDCVAKRRSCIPHGYGGCDNWRRYCCSGNTCLGGLGLCIRSSLLG